MPIGCQLVLAISDGMPEALLSTWALFCSYRAFPKVVGVELLVRELTNIEATTSSFHVSFTIGVLGLGLTSARCSRISWRYTARTHAVGSALAVPAYMHAYAC